MVLVRRSGARTGVVAGLPRSGLAQLSLKPPERASVCRTEAREARCISKLFRFADDDEEVSAGVVENPVQMELHRIDEDIGQPRC